MTSVVGLLGTGLVDPDEPIVRADDFGFTRGDGCFDATRVVVDNDGMAQVDHLEEHLRRFEASATSLEIPFDERAWRRLINHALDEYCQPGEATLKLIVTRGTEYRHAGQPTGILSIDPIPDTILRQRSGMRVVTLNRGMATDAFRDCPWLLGGVKSISYAINMAAKREAARRGADDALFVSADGYALEGPNSALVWAKNKTLFTTPHEHTGVLKSITQAVLWKQALKHHIGTEYRLAPIEEITAADAVWLLSSIRGVAPVTHLDDEELSVNTAWTKKLSHWTGFPC